MHDEAQAAQADRLPAGQREGRHAVSRGRRWAHAVSGGCSLGPAQRRSRGEQAGTDCCPSAEQRCKVPSPGPWRIASSPSQLGHGIEDPGISKGQAPLPGQPVAGVHEEPGKPGRQVGTAWQQPSCPSGCIWRRPRPGLALRLQLPCAA